jgi:glutamate-1-semialdehyde aminotransferase
VTVSSRSLPRSAELLERAASLIPAYTQTLSKNPTQWVRGVAPAFVSRGSGAHVWDVDGNRYVDFPMALGPVILGHAHPVVNAAIARQLEDGIVFTLPHPIELDVAERIIARVPGAERVRFAKSGSDVTSAAIRLARACTGRDRVLAGGYHGWHDWYVGTTTRDFGVPAAVKELTGTFAFGEVPEVSSDVAAVILEPAGVTEPEPGYLQSIVDAAHAAGALVVFDEIITGFRLAPGGAQERYGVRADLVTFGKALGNGMPISALAGRAELMDRLEDVFFSGTHGGETLSLAAARATLDELTPAAFEALYSKGERLRAAVQAAIDSTGVSEWVSIDGAAPRTVVVIREPDPAADGLMARSLVQQEMLKRGVLFNGNNFMCLAHSDEDLDQAAAAYEAAFARLADGLSAGDIASLLEGEPVQPAFRPLA